MVLSKSLTKPSKEEMRFSHVINPDYRIDEHIMETILLCLAVLTIVIMVDGAGPRPKH